MMEFLYFPEDKSEYIPALIILFVFIVGAAAAMFLVYKHSKKEERQANEKYHSILDPSSRKEEK